MSEHTPHLDLLSADTILTTTWPEPAWSIPNYLPCGLSVLAGKSKVGKSWLALQIAKAVASGGDVLAQRVEQGPALVLALEDHPTRLQGRMRKQGWPMGLAANFLTLSSFIDQIGYLVMDKRSMTAGSYKLAKTIEDGHYRFVCIDTLSRALRGNQLDVDDMTRLLAPLQELALRLNCAILLIDHHPKLSGLNPDAVADIFGSTGKGAVADCVWGLYRDRGKKDATLRIVGRDVPQEYELAVDFDQESGTWKLVGDAQKLDLTERRTEILGVIASLGRATLKNITEATGQDGGNTYRRLQDLVAEGVLAREPQGKRYIAGELFDAYS